MDDQGRTVSAYFDHDHGELRRCTDQPTEEQQKFWAAKDAKELAKAGGGGGGGGGGGIEAAAAAST